jgi:hypothetical protein
MSASMACGELRAIPRSNRAEPLPKGLHSHLRFCAYSRRLHDRGYLLALFAAECIEL